MWGWEDLRMLLLSPKGVSQWGRHLGEAAPGGKSGGNVFQVLYITSVQQELSYRNAEVYPKWTVFGRLNWEPCAEWVDLDVNLLV